MAWPRGFSRIPNEPWTTEPVDAFASGYDTVGGHGWYANLQPTVDRLAEIAEEGRVVVDYSGGTGLLGDRLLEQTRDVDFGLLNVDASAKFLRLALDKHGADPRTGFRLLRFQPERMRLESLTDVDGFNKLLGVAAIGCANAVHLYPDLIDTLGSWFGALRPGGTVLVQSGNMGTPGHHWTIDDTVHALAHRAEDLVRDHPQFAKYRPTLDLSATMEAHAQVRRRYFLPVRPVEEYQIAMRGAGFQVEAPTFCDISVQVDEWLAFLDVYSAGILGWVGGSKHVEGRHADSESIADRTTLLRLAAEDVFGGKEFLAKWTYLEATR